MNRVDVWRAVVWLSVGAMALLSGWALARLLINAWGA